MGHSPRSQPLPTIGASPFPKFNYRTPLSGRMRAGSLGFASPVTRPCQSPLQKIMVFVLDYMKLFPSSSFDTMFFVPSLLCFANAILVSFLVGSVTCLPSNPVSFLPFFRPNSLIPIAFYSVLCSVNTMLNPNFVRILLGIQTGFFAQPIFMFLIIGPSVAFYFDRMKFGPIAFLWMKSIIGALVGVNGFSVAQARSSALRSIALFVLVLPFNFLLVSELRMGAVPTLNPFSFVFASCFSLNHMGAF